MNFSLHSCWVPAVSVFLTMVVTAGLFFSILKCKVLMQIEFKFGVSVLQGRCSLEIFGNVSVTTRTFSSNLIGIMRGIKWSIQFESARKIWPFFFLKLVAKIRGVLACSCSKNFCKRSHARIFFKIPCRVG